MSTDQELIDAAQALNSYFVANACTQDQLDVVRSFQNVWNTSSYSSNQQVTVDGQYGPQTQAALQTTMNTLFAPGAVAPDNCFSVAPKPAPAPPAPTPPAIVPVGPSPMPTTSGTDLTVPLLIAAGLVGAGVLGVAVYRKNKKWKRARA